MATSTYAVSIGAKIVLKTNCQDFTDILSDFGMHFWGCCALC